MIVKCFEINFKANSISRLMLLALEFILRRLNLKIYASVLTNVSIGFTNGYLCLTPLGLGIFVVVPTPKGLNVNSHR